MGKTTLFTLLLGAAAFASGAHAQGYVDADGDGINDNAAFMHRRGGFFGHGGGELRGLVADLTDEQKDEIKATVEALRDEGATPEQIHAAIGEKLESFGVALPEGWNVPPPFRSYVTDLTGEQKAVLEATIESLVAEGATRDQIHLAIGEKLESFGVALPEDWSTPPEVRGLLRGLGADLTDEQKAELVATVEALRAEGATRDQVRTAISEKLESYGVTLPEGWDRPPMAPRGFRGFMQNQRLSSGQQTEMQALVKAMRAEGKTAQEIRNAVAAKYQEWGKAMPGRPVRR